MRLRLTSEDELMDIEIRKKIIEEINAPENQARKDEAFKRYQCYKDQTFLYVIAQLVKQFDPSTVREMSYAIANLGFVRKIVDKLARVYKYGVKREVVGDEAATEAMQVAVKESDVDKAFKKTNRFLKLEKNCIQYIVPKSYDEDTKTIKAMVLPPYLYDAVELADDREKAVCYILSDYSQRAPVESNSGWGVVGQASPTPGKHGNIMSFPVYGNKKDEIIADVPSDQKEFAGFVFWSDKYHFTCDASGEIISKDTVNPIEEMPIVNYAEDQDGAFWAIGGSDLVDGAILANSMITNINHIAITQGYGQLVMTGKGLPTQVKVGPNKAVKLEYAEGEPAPTFDFKNAAPPLDELRALVEMYVALLLSTNNLSTSGVSSNLNGGVTFPSGVAMMIDKAESMEDVEDQRQVFIDNEPVFWDIYAKWHNYLKAQGELCESLAAITFPTEEMEISVQFEKPKAIESEKERLEVLKMKSDLGLIGKIDMLKGEYPDLSDEELKAKLEEIMQEKMDAMMQSQEVAGGSQGTQVNEVGDGGDSGNPSVGGDKAGRGGLPSGANPELGGEKKKPGLGGILSKAKPKV